MYTNLPREELIKLLAEEQSDMNFPRVKRNFNLETARYETLDAMYYCIAEFNINCRSSNVGVMRLAELLEINKKHGEPFRPVELPYNINICEFYLNNPHYIKFNDSITQHLPLNLLGLLIPSIKQNKPYYCETFVTNLIKNNHTHNFFHDNEWLLTNYIAWRDIGQKENKLLSEVLVDIDVKHIKYIAYLLKSGFPTSKLSRFFNSNSILFIHSLIQKHVRGEMDLIKNADLFTYLPYPISETVYTESLKNPKLSASITLENLQEMSQGVNSIKDVSPMFLAFDNLNFSDKLQNTYTVNTHSLLLLSETGYDTSYYHSLLSECEELSRVSTDFEGIDAYLLIIICSEIAREQGFDYQRISKTLANRYERLAIDNYYTNSESIDFITLVTKCMCQGDDITIYFDLNLSEEEIKSMFSRIKIQPTLELNSIFYKIFVDLLDKCEKTKPSKRHRR